MHTKPISASQYLSTKLNTPPNLNLLKNNLEASSLFPTILIMAGPFLFPDSKYFLSRLLLIKQQGTVFNFICINSSISWQNISTFLSPRYIASEIPCICYHFQCSKTSTSVTISLITLGAPIYLVGGLLVSCSVLDFSVSNAEMAPDCKYPIVLNRI